MLGKSICVTNQQHKTAGSPLKIYKLVTETEVGLQNIE